MRRELDYKTSQYCCFGTPPTRRVCIKPTNWIFLIKKIKPLNRDSIWMEAIKGRAIHWGKRERGTALLAVWRHLLDSTQNKHFAASCLDSFMGGPGRRHNRPTTHPNTVVKRRMSVYTESKTNVHILSTILAPAPINELIVPLWNRSRPSPRPTEMLLKMFTCHLPNKGGGWK